VVDPINIEEVGVRSDEVRNLATPLRQSTRTGWDDKLERASTPRHVLEDPHDQPLIGGKTAGAAAAAETLPAVVLAGALRQQAKRRASARIKF